MFAVKSIVIARQLDELRAESAARRLARSRSIADETAPPTRPHRRWSALDDPGIELPTLASYPYPAR